ncbi:MAG: hypothetical protein U0269_23245 [Polyangiales bacterium]
MVSSLQHTFDLLHASAERDPAVVDAIDAWQRKYKIELPATVRDLYEHGCAIAMSDSDELWTLPFNELWSEYVEGDFASLESVLDRWRKARAGMTAPELDGLAADPAWGALVLLQRDVMRTHHAFVAFSSEADPLVYEHVRGDGPARWSAPVPLSQWVFAAIRGAYGQDNVPYAFWGPEADIEASEEDAPIAYHRAGLWLRAWVGPLSRAVRSALCAAFTEHSRETVDGLDQLVLIEEFGAIYVRSDDERAPGARASLWISASTQRALHALVKRANALLDQRVAWVADTEASQAALDALGDPARESALSDEEPDWLTRTVWSEFES